MVNNQDSFPESILDHPLRELRIAVLGGDEREIEIVRSFLNAGSVVRTYGTHYFEEYEHLRSPNLEEAVRDADVIVGPAPGVGVDGSLFAPHSDTPIVLDRKVLQLCSDGATVFGGHSTMRMRTAGEPFGIAFQDMGTDDYLQVKHAIPTAEGAIAIAIKHTAETLQGSKLLVVGYGRIGQILSGYLRGMGATVCVAARRREMRARAESVGHESTGTSPSHLIDVLPSADVVFVTASARLLVGEVAEVVRPETLVIDLASPPGGVDHEGLTRRGVHVIWARGQAGTASRHSGRAQFEHMLHTLTEKANHAKV